MKTKTKFVWAIFTLGIALSCKQANYSEELANESKAVADSTSVISSSAAVEPKNSNKKFVRTADIKFKVKNVAKSTTKIEDATSKFGGFVTYTKLESDIYHSDKTKISVDSTLITTKYGVHNTITLRIPNTKMDTLIKSIAKEINYLDYRVIKADDVTLQMLSNKLAQKRSKSTQERIANGIDSKGKKLNQIIDAEENLTNKKEQVDSKIIENLSLEDQVNFSTLSLEIYQEESIQQELIANEKSINAYRPNIGLQIWDSIKTGWFILEKIISTVVILWPFALIGFLIYFGYKKYSKK